MAPVCYPEIIGVACVARSSIKVRMSPGSAVVAAYHLWQPTRGATELQNYGRCAGSGTSQHMMPADSPGSLRNKIRAAAPLPPTLALHWHRRLK